MDHQFNFQQFFNMINNHNFVAPKNIHRRIVLERKDFLLEDHEFDLFSNQIKYIFENIFVLSNDSQQNKDKEIKLQNKLKFQSKPTPMPICNKILNPSEAVFRCYDCMTHEASILCKLCFQNANHKGHRYSQISSGGGNCDCGNPDAIKPQGFCVHHPGKAQPVIVSKDQEEHFLEVMLWILQWLFRLHERQKSKSSDILGQQLAGFLQNINEKSLYYNTLTFNLFNSHRKYAPDDMRRQEKIIDKVFQYGVKLVNFAKKITDVFFNMFSLDIFKYELTVSFTQAYNKIQNFPTSKFKSLYIQLFANNDILQKMLDEKSLVLYPQSQDYDFAEYIENLMFLSTIKPEVASKFFYLLNQKGYVRFPELDIIEKKIQNGDQHIVSVINENLNTENIYFLLVESMIKLLHNNQVGMIQLLRNYTVAVMQKKYSYQNNKAVMPFHKVLGTVLLTIFNANVENINAHQIENYIEGQYSANHIFRKVFKMILECFREFSKTFFETSYFDNYIPLYAKSGRTIVIYDLLMFKICLKIFEQIDFKNQMNQILFEIFKISVPYDNLLGKEEKEQTNKLIQNQSSGMKIIDIAKKRFSDEEEEYESISSENQDQALVNLKINIQLLKIMIEGCVSDRAEILVANSVGIRTQQLSRRTDDLFVEVMNNFRQVTADSLKLINKNFIQAQKLQDDFIKKFLKFDKNKKKYMLNEFKDEKLSDRKFPLYLYPTLKKLGGIFAQQLKENLEEDLTVNLRLTQEKIQTLKFLFNDEFIKKLSNCFIDRLVEQVKIQNKEIKKVFLDFLQTIKILKILMQNQVPPSLESFFDQLIELSKRQQFEFLSEKLMIKKEIKEKESQKQTSKLKFEQKKKAKLQKMKKMQSTFDNILEQQKKEEEHNESICIICREDKPGLCFLANLNYSNILETFNNVDGRSLVFTSCFHPIHITCFGKVKKQSFGYLPCPLCKTESNILLPFEKQICNLSTVNQIYKKIISLKAEFEEEYLGFDRNFEQFGILSIFRALCSMIGKNVIRNEPILNQKDQRLANVLYNMVQTVFRLLLAQQKPSRQQLEITNFLQCLKLQISKEKLLDQTSFHALQYLTLKILYLCFSQKAQSCADVLNQPEVQLINKQDLRMMWQMCDQIVSLPLFNQPQNKNSVMPMASKISFYEPPENLFDLIKIRDSPEMVCKNGHQMCICIVCKQKGCYDCGKIKGHLKKVHCGQGIAFNLLTGGLFYYWQKRMIIIPSYYSNEMGYEWRPSKSLQGFTLDKQNYQELKDQILNQSLLAYLSRKYPDAMKKSAFHQMLF